MLIPAYQLFHHHHHHSGLYLADHFLVYYVFQDTHPIDQEDTRIMRDITAHVCTAPVHSVGWNSLVVRLDNHHYQSLTHKLFHCQYKMEMCTGIKTQ